MEGLAALVRDLFRCPHAESNVRPVVRGTGMCRIPRMLVSKRIGL